MSLTPDIAAALGPPLAIVVWLVLSLRRSPDAPPMSDDLAAIRRDIADARAQLADARERLARLEGALSKG